MWNFSKLDTIPLNSPLSLFSASCHPQTVKYHNENPLSCHPLPLKLLPTCENIGLQSHLGPRNSQAHSSTPHPHQICTPGDPQPQPHPRCALRPSPATPPTHPQPHPRQSPRRTPPSTPALPPHPSHTPDVHLSPQIRMQFPNRSDSAIQSDTNKQAAQRELHAKLQHLRPLAGPVAPPHGGHRAQAATHPDR